MRDEAYKTCPKELCQQAKWGKGKVKRLLGTGAGLIFKGSGFYITDYRSNSYKEAAKKESPGGGEKSGGRECRRQERHQNSTCEKAGITGQKGVSVVTTTTTTTITLVCPDCQHENEPQRIYCHSCGARLDRSKLSCFRGSFRRARR